MPIFQQLSHYPISLQDIEIKFATRKSRQRKLLDFEGEPFNNVKTINNEFGERIVRIDGEIPIDLKVKNGNRFLFISYDQSVYTHGLHRYPAKFFPELPRWLIKRYSYDGDFVLDPFTGSGTTNLEALLLGRRSVGIDVDPFSRFLARVKTTPLAQEELETAKEFLLRRVVNYRPSKALESDIPVFPYRDSWFNKEILLELTYLKKSIEALPAGEDVKNFFRICFSSIIRFVSNADDNCTRTVVRKKLNKKVYPADALKKFAKSIFVNTPKMVDFSRIYPAGIKATFPDKMDARRIDYENNTFDLAVTSPPYVNAVDYPRTHQLEIYWLGFANGSLSFLKKKHVGTENVLAENYKRMHKTGVKEADIVIRKIFQKDPRRAYIAYKYLEDMRENLKEIFRVLKRGGMYTVVLGNNRIRGNLFENWKYVMEMAKGVGFKVENYFASEIIRHFIKVPREERIDTDWVLVLKK